MGDRPLALVTGASGGIGEAFARELARQGHDLVIVARSADRLEKLAAELGEVEVEVLPADLQASDQLATVEKRVSAVDRPVDILVNNAGYGTAGAFRDLPIDREIGSVDLNISALVRLTHAALQPMVERGSGGILNVASIGAFQPAPNNATYSATKAFVLSFSEALHEEVKPLGVRVTCLAPGLTRTEFQQTAGISGNVAPGFMWADANDVARVGLKGLRRNKAVIVPGFMNKATAMLVHLMPRAVVRKAAKQVTKRF